MEDQGRRRHRRSTGPTGVGGKGNEGVAAYVQRINGSIGYVEYAYAKQNKMTLRASCRTATASSSQPDDEAFKAAAAGADWAKAPGFYLILTDQPGKDALADHRRDLHPDAQGAGQAAKAQGSAEVLRLGLSRTATSMADELDYVPMPDAVVKLDPGARGRRRSRTPPASRSTEPPSRRCDPSARSMSAVIAQLRGQCAGPRARARRCRADPATPTRPAQHRAGWTSLFRERRRGSSRSLVFGLLAGDPASRWSIGGWPALEKFGARLPVTDATGTRSARSSARWCRSTARWSPRSSRC